MHMSKINKLTQADKLGREFGYLWLKINKALVLMTQNA